MNYEFTIEAQDIAELQDALLGIVAALKLTRTQGVLRFARYPHVNENIGCGTLPTREPDRMEALEASARQEVQAEDDAPVVRRRRRRTNGSTADVDVVANPDGEVVALVQPMAATPQVDPDPAPAPQPAPPPVEPKTVDMDALTKEALAELPEGFGKPPPEDTPDMSPGDMRERAINLMQQAFGYASGPDLVRAVHRRLKVRKIADVPDDKCRELLDDATAVLTQLKATSEPLDFLAMAQGKKG